MQLQKIYSFISHPDRRNFFIYSIGAFFLKGISFFLIPMYTNLLSAAEFGSYDLLRNFGSITEIVLSLGLLQLIYVEFFDKNQETKTKFISSFLSIYLVISGSLYVLVAVGMFFFSGLLFPGVKFILVIMVLITTYLNFFQVMLVTVMKLSLQAVRVTTLQVVLGCTNLALNILLVYGLKTGIDGIIISTLVITVMSCIYGMYLFSRQLKSFKISLNWSETKQYLKFSLPFIPNVLSFWVMNSANRWILLNYSGLDEVGIYSVAARLTAVFEPMLIEPFLAAYTPIILKKFKDGNYSQSFFWRTLLIPIVFCVAGFALQQLGNWVIGEEFAKSMILVIPLSIAYAFNLVAQSSALILIHKKMVNTLLACVIAGSATSILLNFALVPHYGSLGSVWGAVAGNATWAFMVTIFAILVYKKFRNNSIN